MSDQKVIPRMNKRLTQIEAKKITSRTIFGHKMERMQIPDLKRALRHRS